MQVEAYEPKVEKKPPPKNNPYDKYGNKRPSGKRPKKRRFHGKQFKVREIVVSDLPQLTCENKVVRKPKNNPYDKYGNKRPSGKRPKKRRFHGNQFKAREIVPAMSIPPRSRISKDQKRNVASSSSESSSSDSENGSEAVEKMSHLKIEGKQAIRQDGMAVCDYCGNVGVKHAFYSKEKRFCSLSCARIVQKSKSEKANIEKCQETLPPVPKKNVVGLKKSKTDVKGSFDWLIYLVKPDFMAAPVSCFKHVALSDCWNSIIENMKVEIENTDCANYSSLFPTFYWIASVIKISGYMALLRYEGFGTDDSKDFWVNLCTESLHPVGWCASQGKPLIPPKSIEQRQLDWKQFLMKRLTGSRTLPTNFAFKVEESMNNIIQKGMKLEVVDKNRISAVRVATVGEVVGGRLHVTYDGSEEEDEGFWCHERSPLIHPVGWAQVIGHDLRATPEYAKTSLHKTLFRKFEQNDATWDMFLPVLNPVTDLKFKIGMKLEAIDPLNLSTICVATVTRVLRNNYLMIGIDGMMAANGSDWFCYHASSPCIFPVGFCKSNDIKLTPPRGYKGEFKWEEYLKQTKSTAAPVGLFKKEIPDHGFEEGMHMEAVDLMEPRLICVGSVTKVVGRLLRIHFDGWEDAYDQWCDCESPDFFPVGWCQVVGYRLEPPRSGVGEDFSKKKKKYTMYKGNRKKKKNKFPLQGRRPLFRPTAPFANSYSNKQKDDHDNAVSDSDDVSPSKVADKSTNNSPTSTDSSKKISPENTSKSSSEPSISSPLTETNPYNWSVAEVAQFLRINECGAYSQIFSQEKVDGRKFVSLSKEGLMSLTGMKVGPSLKIYHLIQQLRAKTRNR